MPDTLPPPPPPNTAGWLGFQRPGIENSDFATLQFVIQSLIGKLATATVVQVKGVTNNGGILPVGFVDIQPLVNQLDGAGNATAHGIIYKCPYFRLQGGTNAIILDPQVGDLGIAIFADRDISSVSANAERGNRGPANPGSWRRFAWADGLYLGGVLNGIPEQFVQFSPAGIRIHSNNLLQLDAPNIIIHSDNEVVINADGQMTVTTPLLTINGNVYTNGELKNNGVFVGSAHVHIPAGGPNTGPPIS